MRMRRQYGLWGVLLALFVLVVVWPTHAFARSYSISSVDIQAVLDQAGTLNVQETRTFDFNGSFHGVYWDIPKKSYVDAAGNYHNIDVTLGEIGEKKDGHVVPFKATHNEVDGTYEVTDEGTNYRVKLFSAHQDESAQFVITYQDSNVASRYADVGELYWQFVSSGWEVASHNVTCSIHLPVPQGEAIAAGDNVRAWGHGPLDASLAIGQNAVTYTVPRVESSEFAEARITFPQEWLQGVPQGTNTMLPSILDEEQGYAQKANKQRMGMLIKTWGVAGMTMALGVALVVLTLLQVRRYKKDHTPQFSDTYFRDVPSADHPAVLGTLYEDGKAGVKEFTASLMRLTDAGVIALEEVSGEHKGLFGHKKEQQSWQVRKLQDLALTPDERKSRSMEAMSKRIDVATLTFLFHDLAGLAEGATYQTLELSTLSIIANNNAYEYAKAFEEWTSTVEGATIERGFFQDAHKLHKMLGFILLALCLAGGLLVLGSLLEGALPLWFGLLTLAVAALAVVGWVLCTKKLKPRSARAVELCARLLALKRWLKEFTHLNEAVPHDVTLWGRLLVMSVVLGVSDEVVKQLKVALPELTQLDSDSFLPAYIWWMYSPDLGNGATSPFDALSTSLASAHEMSAADLSNFASGAGGGGGFSGGGGGGFGGGGGGGAF